MLIYRTVHHAFLTGGLLDGGKELGFFVVMVFRNAVMPSEAIADEIAAIARPDPWSLLIDAVEAANEGIVAQDHVRSFNGKRVRLVRSLRSIHTIRIRIDPHSLFQTLACV